MVTRSSMSSKSIKEFLHPGLMYLLTTIVCYYVSTIQTDVKTLLAQSNVDKTEIAQLKQDVADLKQVVFLKRAMVVTPKTEMFPGTIALTIFSADRFFKHEEEMDPKRYLPRRI